MFEKHKIFIFLIFSIFCSKQLVSFDSKEGLQKAPYTQMLELQMFYPIYLTMRAEAIVNIAKKIVNRPDFEGVFKITPESQLKILLRRQYYLQHKGVSVDNYPLSFSIQELFNAGVLDKNIKDARRSGILDLSNLRIDNLDGINNVAENVRRNINQLNLSNNQISFVTNNDFSSIFSYLKSLNLSDNKIFFLEKVCFDNLNNLEFLDLGQNKLNYLPNAFALLSKLTKLDLSDNFIKSIEPWKLKALINLEYLNLADNDINNKEKNKLLDVLPKLKEVY